MTTTASQRDSGGTWRQHIAGFRQIWGLASIESGVYDLLALGHFIMMCG